MVNERHRHHSRECDWQHSDPYLLDSSLALIRSQSLCVNKATICRHTTHSRLIHFEVCGAAQVARSSTLLYLVERQAAELTFASKHLKSR
jgi:hypothetical protein